MTRSPFHLGTRHLLVFVTGIVLTATLASNQSFAQAKWWWESYPAEVNKTLGLRGASGGSVSASKNPTGANAVVTAQTATQPPTVVIQQTAAAASTGMTCAIASFGVGTSNAYGAYFATPSCPTIPGYSTFPITATSVFTGTSQTVASSCCYVKTQDSGGSTVGGAYDPWAANTTPGGGAGYIAYKTPSSYAWTVPAGVYRVWLSMAGGGGGGASGDGSFLGGGGGSGGITYRYPLNVFPGDVVTIYVGAGGAGGTTGSGAPGAATTVITSGNTYTAGGGGQGNRYNGNGSCSDWASMQAAAGSMSQGGIGGYSYCNSSNHPVILFSKCVTSDGSTHYGPTYTDPYFFGHYAWLSSNGNCMRTSLGPISSPNPGPLPPINALGNSIGGASAWGPSLSNGGPGFMGIKLDPAPGTAKASDGGAATSSSCLGGKGYGAGGGGGCNSGVTPGGRGADGYVAIEW